MHRTLNVALVGYGFAGKVFHAPLIKAVAGLDLHTVVSSDPDKVLADLPGVRVVADPADACQDPAIDLVVVAAPNPLHAPLAHLALAQGKHVVVDKPFALDSSEARAVLDHAQRVGRIASVFQNRRWDADFLTLRQLIDAGELGEVAEFHSHFDRFRPQVADRWREHDQPGSGQWFDLGPHLLDQALQLFGMPLAVQADIDRQRPGAQVDDWFHVTLRYPRLRAHLHAGSLVADNRLRMAVHGSGGSYLKYGMDGQEAAMRAGVPADSAGWGIDPRPGTLVRAAEAGAADAAPVLVPGVPGDYPAYYRQLRDAILDGAPPPVTAAQALQVMQLLELAVASACERRELPAPADRPAQCEPSGVTSTIWSSHT